MNVISFQNYIIVNMVFKRYYICVIKELKMNSHSLVFHLGRIGSGEGLAVVTQTTLSVDDAVEIASAIKARFPLGRSPKQQDICYTTQNHQDAVKMMSPQVDTIARV